MKQTIDHYQFIDAEDAARYREEGAWLDLTLFDYLETNATTTPHREALVDPANKSSYLQSAPRRLSWGDLLEEVEALCLLFKQQGVTEGDVIVLQLPNTWEAVASLFAITRLGAIVSPISVQSREAELSYAIGCLSPVGFICSRSYRGFDHVAYLRNQVPDFDGFILAIEDIADLVASSSLEQRDDATYDLNPNPDGIATICWTSGTEGVPKAVPRTHNNWTASAIGVSHGFGMGDKPERILLPFPLINTAAIGGVTMPWLYNGGTLILHQPFDISVLTKQLIAEQVTVMLASPTALQAILESASIRAAGNELRLRAVGCGSAAPSPALLSHYEDQLGISIINMFGANEGTLLCSDQLLISDPEDRATVFPRTGIKSVCWSNPAANWLSSRLIDVEDGKEILLPDKTGLLVVKGPSIFPGYVKNRFIDRSAFTTDGYFRTGDLFQITCRQDKDHYLKVIGRHKDLVIRGGYNISPLEVDSALAGLAGVAELACAGIYDERYGERLCLYIVLQDGASVSLSKVQQHLEARGLAKTKWPEKLVIVESLPRNTLNKVLRQELGKQSALGEETSF